MRSRTISKLTSAFIALALVGAACGDDSDSSAPTTTAGGGAAATAGATTRFMGSSHALRSCRPRHGN